MPEYKIYMVFENMSVEGKYIPLLYTASDNEGDNAILPSDATTYTDRKSTRLNSSH